MQEVEAAVLVEMDEHLGIGMVGGEAVAGALQRLAQLDVIVDFAVEDHGDRSILVENRLLAGRHVDDGQAAHPQRNALPFPITGGVRAPMTKALRHQFQRCSIVRSGEASYAAHCGSVADAKE